jgi:hypothetical protein
MKTDSIPIKNTAKPAVFQSVEKVTHKGGFFAKNMV